MTADHDTLFLQAALHKELLSPDEGREALAEARARGVPVETVLIEQGLITERTRSTLTRDVARVSARLGRAAQQHGGAPVPMAPPTPPPAPRQATPQPVAPPARTAAPPPQTPSSALVATAYEPASAATLPTPPPGSTVPSARGGPTPLPERIGPYRVLSKLGQGGMGAVYKARDEHLERDVALKVLAPAIAADPQSVDRFLREARAAAAINHPNVITVLGAGEEAGQPYMALEYLPGGDAEVLARNQGGRLSEHEALRIARDCARGLVAIERAGLVHRDLKPANIFMGEDGLAKLADLGLARTQTGDDRMTQTGAIVGTPAFMAPEQAEGETDLDIRTDIYALGASLYTLLTGSLPFTGSSAFVIVSNVLNQPAPDPRELVPNLSAATCALIDRAMRKGRRDRFHDASEFLDALEDALQQVGGERGPVGGQVGVGAAAPSVFQQRGMVSGGGGGGGSKVDGQPPQEASSWWAARPTWQKIAISIAGLSFLVCRCLPALGS